MLPTPHKFYLKSKSQQNLYFTLLIGGLCLVVLFIGLLSWYFDNYFINVLIPILALNVAPFLDVPMGKRKGRFMYFSACFITEWHPDGRLILHGGTLFDYWFTIDKRMSAKERLRLILKLYLEGLLNLINYFEEKKEADIRIIGTTFFINKRNLNRLGFEVVPTSVFQALLIGINYFTISGALSFVNRSLTFFSFKNMYSFETDLSTLSDKKEIITQLYKHLIE